MKTQPEALRLANSLEAYPDALAKAAAAELQRLHKVETKSKKYGKRLVKMSFEKKELLKALKQCRESLRSAEAFNQLAVVDEIIFRVEADDVAIP